MWRYPAAGTRSVCELPTSAPHLSFNGAVIFHPVQTRIMTNTYFIKPGYEPSQHTESYDPEASRAYWTEERIHRSRIYQYHVYTACRRLIRTHHCNSFLEVGSGPGIKAAELLAPELKHVTLVDQPSVEPLVSNNLPNAVFASVNLELSDLDLGRQFDVVLCADVVEHLVDPDPCVRLIKRHLGPAGYAVISTPERDILHGPDCNHSPHHAHIREWNQAEFAAWLTSHGLKIVQHTLLPQARLGPVEYVWSRILRKFVARPRWFGCQMAVVQNGT